MSPGVAYASSPFLGGEKPRLRRPCRIKPADPLAAGVCGRWRRGSEKDSISSTSERLTPGRRSDIDHRSHQSEMSS